MKFHLFALCFLLFCGTAYAKEIVILYTGETHAMLYPCSCPKGPDGGLARRATLIKEMKARHPDALLLDAGAFFAGGLLDEYAQNTQLDMERTAVNLEAMKKMGYDAVAIGDNEFNFGESFLFDAISKTNLPFLSCNVRTQQAEGVKPFIIKDVSGTKIGIIGVTNLAARNKSGTLRFSEPKQAVKKAVEELKSTGADIIVLLSQLAENDDLSLIEEIKGIDVLIGSHHPFKDQAFVKFENTLLLKTFWQGRNLGVATLTVENNELTEFKVNEVRLSDEVADDADIPEILPRCFSDQNCRRQGLAGSCRNPGTPEADCLFSAGQRISLVVITDKSCVTCNPDAVIDLLKKDFPGLEPAYLYYPEKKAKDLIKDFDISSLPAYLLSKEAEKEERFESLRENFQAQGDFYLVKPTYSGISYLFNRKKIKGRLDLFISLYDQNAEKLLEVIKDFNPQLHFLVKRDQAGFDAAQGEPEVEEYLRVVCVQKHYPQKFWEYIRCRSKNIHSTWWDDCASDLDARKIKTCAKGAEGTSLLKDYIGLSEELRILFGPTYLLNNQEIFVSNGVPSKEELEAIIQK
ncbi:MAG: metallophosphatase [Candidatus Omnitrophota bacterium]